jgi:hypothetical protein
LWQIRELGETRRITAVLRGRIHKLGVRLVRFVRFGFLVGRDGLEGRFGLKNSLETVKLSRQGNYKHQILTSNSKGAIGVGTKKTGKGRRKLGQKKRRMRAKIRHRKK